MKTFLVLIGLIISTTTIASTDCASVKDLSYQAYLDADSMVEIAKHRDASFNVRNVCYGLGRFQVNTNLAMGAAIKCFAGDTEVIREATELSNFASSAVKLCHEKLDAEKVYEAFYPVKFRLQKFAF